MKILFLEDQPSLIQRPVEFLRTEGFDVEIVDCAEDAYTAFEKDIMPRICFFDIDLKHKEKLLDGLDVAQVILLKHKNINIIMYTHHSGVAEYFERAKGLEIEFVDRGILENNAWLLDQINQSIIYKGNRDDKVERFILIEQPVNSDYGQISHILKPSDIVCLQSKKESSYTNVFIQRKKAPILQTATIGEVYNFFQKRVNIDHLIPVSANCYINMEEIVSLEGTKCTLSNGLEIILNGTGRDTIKESFPIFLVSHMHPKKK